VDGGVGSTVITGTDSLRIISVNEPIILDAKQRYIQIRVRL